MANIERNIDAVINHNIVFKIIASPTLQNHPPPKPGKLSEEM